MPEITPSPTVQVKSRLNIFNGFNCGLARQQTPLELAPYVTWEDDDKVWAEFYRLSDSYLFRLIDLCDFEMSSDGLSCTSYPLPSLDTETLQHLFRNHVQPLLWNRQGKLVFHASCVDIGGRAIAFMGDSGLGKSTLATGFARNGNSFLSDDGLLVQRLAGRYHAFANEPSIRLWEASEAALITPSHIRGKALSFTNKLRVMASPDLPYCKQPLPISAVFFLEDNGVDILQIRKLSGADKHAKWANCGFNLDVWDKASMKQNFQQIADLANEVPSFRLDYPRDFDRLNHVIRTIISYTQKEISSYVAR